MARFVTTLPSDLSPEHAFDLLANFDRIAEWDPGVAAAQRLDSGELQVGSTFRVEVALGPVRIPLTYAITEFDPGTRVVLDAVTSDFTSHDVVTVAATPTGSTVTYDATLTLHGWRRIGEPGLRLAFIVIGRRAEGGLRRALRHQGAAA